MNIIFGIIGYGMLLLMWLYGIDLLLSASDTLRIARQSRRWFSTQALVSDYKVSHYNLEKGGVTHYGYVVIYTYIIDGIGHTCEGFDRGAFKTKAEAKVEVERLYPIGSIVNVFYNPRSHRESVTSTGFTQERAASFLFSLMVSCMILTTTTKLLVIPIFWIFHVSTGDAVGIIQPLFSLGMIATSGCFCCFGFLMIWFAVSKREMAHFFMGCFFLAIFLPSTIVMSLDILGLLKIGLKPSLQGCYRPDFKQMKWTPISCPKGQ
jgi:Protein of unknown function (DUF3592)